MKTIDSRSTPGDRTWRRVRAALTVGALAAIAALALAYVAPGPELAQVAGQVQPTSTPIRLTRVTPASAPSPTPAATEAAAGPASGADPVVVVVVTEDEATDPADDSAAEVAIDFEADDWAGGYFQGNGAWYGRAWTAVYGAQSEYPAATLTFELEAAPEADLVLTVEGLDDEVAGANPIAVEVNGDRVYEGDSPFESWDGNTANQAQDARWTTVEITLPAELFGEGENTIAFLNLSPSADVGLPPYNLLSTASLATDTGGDDQGGDDGGDDDGGGDDDEGGDDDGGDDDDGGGDDGGDDSDD